MAQELAAQADLQVPAGELDEWVRREQDAVTQHLSEVLAPDPLVRQVVQSLRARYRLAVVSSSALARLDACLRATGLVEWLPMEQCFSAQDSLPTPTSKPDPAVYLAAVAALEVDASRAVAVEDAVAGVRSAVDAGIPVVGNLAFVPSDQQDAREAQLLAAGAEAVVRDWRELAEAFGVASPADSLA
jgi:beta-phosphoglucomutase-like phosphatase (HAD superfamily)